MAASLISGYKPKSGFIIGGRAIENKLYAQKSIAALLQREPQVYSHIHSRKYPYLQLLVLFILKSTCIRFSWPHTSLKLATTTVPGFRAWGNNTQPHRRCLPLTGSEENATMLNPTVRENLLFPSSSPSARRPRRFPQVQSMVAYGAKHLPIS